VETKTRKYTSHLKQVDRNTWEQKQKPGAVAHTPEQPEKAKPPPTVETTHRQIVSL
jgi:hypothetical protein